MDELEAGEAAVELDDKEPQEVLAWAIEKFGNAVWASAPAFRPRLRADRHGVADRSQASASSRSIPAASPKRPTS